MEEDNLPTLNGAATVVMVVNGAPITIQVDGANAPITAGNFVDLVERDIYDGTTFHRVEVDPEPFVVQGGDPQSKDPAVPTSLLGTGNFIDPATGQPRFIPLEIKPQGATEPLYSQTFEEAGITVAPALPNVRGSVAMARSDAGTDTASSQFYFNLADSDFLNGNYAVFGTVTQGLDIIDEIIQGDRILDAEVIEGIIPSRVSSLLTDANLLNGFINTINRASLPLTFLYPRELDANNVIQLTPDLTENNPRGVLVGGGNDQVTGSEGRDVINGNADNDTLAAAAGNDYIFGGQGDDAITGGAGNDILNGNRGADTIFGGAGDDFIRGGQGNDNLTGDDGNDFLLGDLGFDTLTGGVGADTFLLRVDEATGVQDQNLADKIVDLNVAEGDRITIIGTINAADLSFTTVGSDTVIRLANSGILGVVQNSQASAVQGAVSVLAPTDLGLTIG